MVRQINRIDEKGLLRINLLAISLLRIRSKGPNLNSIAED